jgi:glutaconate CoA-transferase subunit B
VESIAEHTGFEFERPAEVPETPAPTDAELALMRGAVGEEVAEVYPAFAERIWNIRSAATET